MVRNPISSYQFQFSMRGNCFAKAGSVSFKMLSERRTGAEQSCRIEIRID
jgi:hypothetical protein